MTTYNTGNPVGSPAPKDLYDNAENLDTALHTGENTWADRLGNTRTSWAGATGYQILGDYAGGIEITERNQIVREGGEYWRLKGSVDLPYTTTGTWVGDDEDRFVSVGDAVLRSELALDNGGELIGTGAVTKVANVAELRALTGLVDGQRVSVTSYHDGWAAMSRGPVGGGEMVWDAASTDAHNGVTVFSVTGVATGRWKRKVKEGRISLFDAGCIGDDNDDTESIAAAILAVYNADGVHTVKVPEGAFVSTEVVVIPSTVSMVGAESNQKTQSAKHVIKKTTSNTSPIQAARSTVSTDLRDGFDGVDHFPNCVSHIVATPSEDGIYSGVIEGVSFDGAGVCDHGLYVKRASNCSFKYNRVSNVDTGIVFWNYIFLSEFLYNTVSNVQRGVGLDAATTLDFHGNFVNTYGQYAYKVTGATYSQFASNAADSGAVGETGSYATAYWFRQCSGCGIKANGAEVLNGIFFNGRELDGCSVENNFALAYGATYTGGDTIAAFYLDFPTGEYRNNKIVFDLPVNKGANRWNLYVENFYGQTNFDWLDNNNTFIDGTSSAVLVHQQYLEEGFGKSTALTAARGMSGGQFASDTVLYVRSGGSDTNNAGSVGAAAATIQGVIDRLPRRIDSIITIDVGPGTFGAFSAHRIYGTGKVVISGDGAGSTIIDGANTISRCRVPVDITAATITATGSTIIHILYDDADGSVHAVDYNTVATGTANQFVQARGTSRVGVYSNTYTYTTGANLIRVGGMAHIQVDQATASAVNMAFGSAGRISIAGVETTVS